MNANTLLSRQVHPAWEQQNRVTSQVFHPSTKDKGCLSVYDGDLIAPVDSWEHYSRVLGWQSVGVVAVTVAECEPLPGVPDPTAFLEHVLIDFRGLSNNKARLAAQNLRNYAETRGWLFRPLA